MIQWTSVQDGVEYSVLSGSLELPGEHYTVRFRTSQQIKVTPHWHPTDEHITVLQGPFALGFGETFAPDLLTSLPTGSYVCVTQQTRHFALYGIGTVVQVSGIAPFKTIYVDASRQNPNAA